MTSMIEYRDVTPMAARSAEEMSYHLAETQQQMAVVQKFFREVMVDGQDYGVIPGTDKPALLKPGAEKLCELYGYAPTVKHVDEDRELHTGFLRARVTVALVSKKTGDIVAEGVGEANTMESRYRWRWVWEDKLPAGIDKASLVKNGKKYRMENDDPFSLWNTVLKMAKKRALVDAALSATRSSGLFTQDPEAFDKWMEEGEDGPAPKPGREPVRKTQPRSASVEREPAEQAGTDYTTFWKEARSLGFDNTRVFAIAKADNLDGWSQAELDGLLAELRDVAAKTEPQQPALA